MWIVDIIKSETSVNSLASQANSVLVMPCEYASSLCLYAGVCVCSNTEASYMCMIFKYYTFILLCVYVCARVLGHTENPRDICTMLQAAMNITTALTYSRI